MKLTDRDHRVIVALCARYEFSQPHGGSIRVNERGKFGELRMVYAIYDDKRVARYRPSKKPMQLGGSNAGFAPWARPVRSRFAMLIRIAALPLVT